MTVITNISVDLLRPSIYPKVNAVKDDVCTRDVVISLYSGGVSWPVPEGVSAAVGYHKPDGTVGLYDTLPDGSSAVKISGNTVTLTLAAQMLTAVGAVEAAVTLAEKSGNQITTFAFDVIVSANPGSGAIKSEDYFNYVNPKIQAVIEQAAAATTAANTAASRANASAELAEDAYDLADTANQKVDTLREVVSKLHSNIVETVSGEVITVSDSAEAPLQGLKVFGKTEQRTTTGKNLLSGFTGTKENPCSLTANTDDDTYHMSDVVVLLKEGTTYTSSIYTDGTFGTSSGSDTVEYLLLKDGQYDYFIGSGPGMYQEGHRIFKTFTPMQTGIYSLRLDVNKNGATHRFWDAQVELGSTATAYEPYTGGAPSPSPDYPQALESVGDSGSVTTTVCGKNLYHQGGDWVTQNKDGTYTITATASSERAGLANLLTGGIPKGIYTFSYLQGYGELRIQLTEGVNTYVLNVGQSKTFEYDGESYLRIFSVDVPAGATATYKVQLEQGDKATDWEPYKEPTAVTVTPKDSSGNALYLPGIPVTSGGNYTDPVTKQQWICDEVDFEKGVYVQRVGVVDYSDSNAPWATAGGTKDATKHRWVLAKDAKLVQYHNIISDAFCTVAAPGTAEQTYLCKDFISIAGSSMILYLEEVASMSETAANAWLREKNVKALYILAEEKYIPLTAEELAQYAALHTNYPNTTVYNDAGAHMDLKYVADTKKYVDKKFAELAAALVSST